MTTDVDGPSYLVLRVECKAHTPAPFSTRAQVILYDRVATVDQQDINVRTQFQAADETFELANEN